MDKCPKCGNKLSPVDVLCPRCGALVEVIHVASHPNAVSAENAGVVISRQPRPDEVKNDFLMTRQAQKAASPAKESDMPISLQAQNDVPALAEDDLPMSRQARKAALRAQKVKEVRRKAPKKEDTDIEDTPSKKWLEIEEIAVEETPERQVIAADETAIEDNSFYETADDGIFDSQTSDALPEDNELSDDAPRRFRMHSTDEPVSEPHKKMLRRRSPVALIVLMWVVIAAAIFGAFYFLDTHVAYAYGGWDDFVRQITNSKIELDTSASYLNSINVNISEFQTENGAPAHRFDINMSDAKSVKVLPLGDTFDMDNGSASFTVADEELARKLGEVSSDPTIDTDGVSLEVSTSSQTFTYPVTSLRLMLTEAIYTRETPSTQIWTEETLPIAMTVSPDASVFINNANHATEIDENGHLSVSMPLDMGENLFVIEVIQPGRRTVKENFKITREEERTSLAPSADYLRVNETSFECLGTTAPGATITATLGSQSFTALVAADGSFSLACSVEEIGIHELTIRASIEGHSNAEATVAVEYLPEPNTFMAGAKELSVGQITKDLNSLGDTGIKAAGTVGSLTSETNKQTFVLTNGSDTISCYYYGTVRLSQNSAYTFFGIADPERSSFYVMYVV